MHIKLKLNIPFYTATQWFIDHIRGKPSSYFVGSPKHLLLRPSIILSYEYFFAIFINLLLNILLELYEMN